MAGPSIAVKVLADLTGFQKSMGDTATQGESTSSRLKSAFSGMLGALNATGVLGPFTEVLNGVGEAVSAVAEHGKELGPAFMGVGTAVAGVGAGLSMLGSKDQAAHQQLQASIAATGADYSDFSKQIDDTVKHQENFGHSASETEDALNTLTQQTGSAQTAINDMGLVADLAAAKHESLATAAQQVGKATESGGKLFTQYGITIDAGKTSLDNHAKALDALAEKLRGQASASTDTFAGKLDVLKTKVEDQIAAFGSKYGPALTAAGTAMAGLGSVMEIATAINGAFTASEDAATVSEYAFLAPAALIIAGLAAIGVAAYELYTHWTQVWGFIKSIVMDVWNWIVANWPLLAGILFGPIGYAVALIIQNFGTIKAWALDAVNFIRGIWGDIVGFFQSIVGAIAGVFAGLEHFIEAPFVAAYNAIMGIVNQIKGAVADVGNAVKSLPGGGIVSGALGAIGIHLQEGGIVTSPTVALIGEGGPEAVIPLSKAKSMGGPAVHIENVNLHDGADVGLLLQKIHFATMAGTL